MNPNQSTASSPSVAQSRWRRSLFTWVAIVFSLIFVEAQAQSSGTGTITGRVLNVRTGDYLRNAVVSVVGTEITTVAEAGGNYRLLNVPVGGVKLKVEYAGLDAKEEAVTIIAGQTVTKDFDLTSAAYDNDTLVLDRFIVAGEREGNAKAIMDQRNAENLKRVVSSDSFGNVSEGNAGEFLKLMPGLSIDYVEADARSVRIRGADPKYTVVLMDGAPIASAGSSSLGTGRVFEFEQTSMNSIESVEVSKTPSAADAASSVAGVVNLRSKGAFDRKGRRISFSTSLAANEYYMSAGKTAGIDDDSHYKLSPNVAAEFSDVLLDGKLGVLVGMSFSNTLTAQKHIRTNNSGQGALTWDALPGNNETEVPRVPRFNFRDGPKSTKRTNYNIRLDYKFSPNLLVWGRLDFNQYYARFFLRDVDFVFTTLDATANNTPMSQTTTATGGSVAIANSGNDKLGDTVTTTSGLTYKVGALTIDGLVQYSRATNFYKDLSSGFFAGMGVSLPSVGLKFDRSGSDATDITITQISGADWRNMTNYRYNTNATTFSNLISNERSSKDQKWTGKLDMKYAADAWNMPVTIKFGGAVTESYRDINRWSDSYQYLGADKVAGTADDLQLPADYYEKDYAMDFGMGGNVNGLYQPSQWNMAKVYEAHPDWFQRNWNSSFYQYIFGAGGNVDLKEQINALYLSPIVKVTPKLSIAPGFRYEDTRSWGNGRNDIGNANAQVKLGNLPTTAAPAATAATYYDYVVARYGVRKQQSKNYGNFFKYLQGKYDFTKDFTVRASYHESISRPDLGNIVPGVTGVDDGNTNYTKANPNLKPETSRSFNVSAEYYFSNAGYVTATVFRSDLKNAIRTVEEPGDPADGFPITYEKRTPENIRKARRQGIELDYGQQLTFLPSYLKGFGVFANYTYVQFDIWDAFLSSPKVMGNAGISYTSGRFNGRINSNYTGKKMVTGGTVAIATGDIVAPANGIYSWERDRLMFDMELNFKLTKALSAFATGRNLTNEPYYIYQNKEQYFTRVAKFGALYTFGVKGSF